MERFKEKNPMSFVRGCVFFFAALAAVYMIYGQFFLPKDSLEYDTQLTEFNDGWYEIKEDGTRSKITLPGSYDSEIVMEAVLPEDLGENGCYIQFRGEKTDIYIDDELRISYDNRDKRIFSNLTTEAYIMLQLYPEDAGKTIRAEMSSFSGILYQVNIGSLFAIWYNIFARYDGELLIALLTIFLAVLAILCCIFLKKTFGQIKPLIYLSCGIITGSLWIICNTAMRETYFNNIGMATDMCFLMIMLTPFFVMLYLNELQQRRYELVYFIASCIHILVFISCTVLHVLGIRDYHQSFMVIDFGCFVAIVVASGSIIADVICRRIHEYFYVAIGLLCVCFASAIELISYSFRSDAFSGELLSIGMMLMLVFAVIHTMKDAAHMMELKREAELASEAKGQFLANMSHEIRTPINAVLGMNEMILRETKESETKEYATDIKAAGSSLLSLVNDILDFSKIEAGKMDLVPVEYDFANLIYAVIIMIRPRAEGKGLDFFLNIDEKLPRELYGDDVRLRQIILNILSNAVKYTESGSVTMSISGYYILHDVMLEISIKDTGIGIKPEDMGKLYSEFERFDQSKNHMVEGTGLGMSITNRLLVMMDSRLEVESEYGSGSTFSFKVRQRVIDTEPIGKITEEGRVNKMETRDDTILYSPDSRICVVDDKELNRKVFCNLVKKNGMKVDQADSGAACIKLAKENTYDIIFLDHMMPEMDGIETLHKMREMKLINLQQTKVIVLTANAIKGAKEHYLAEGFDDYMSKPVLPENLKEMLRTYLKSYEELTPEEREKIDHPGKDSASQQPKDTEEAPQGAKEESVWDQMAKVGELDVMQAAAFNPDEEMMEEVLEGFYQAIGPDADSLEGLYAQMRDNALEEAKDEENGKLCDEYRIKVHAMKSSAKMIGAMGLSEEAFELEQASRDKDLERVLEKTPAFLEHYRKYTEYLSFIEKPAAGGGAQQLDAMKYKTLLAQIFHMLSAYMEELDIDNADAIVALLGQYRFPEELGGDLKALEQAVGQLDIPGTEELVKRFLAALG